MKMVSTALLTNLLIGLLFGFQVSSYQLKRVYSCDAKHSAIKALTADSVDRTYLQITPAHTRRKRYTGKYPKYFDEKYKEAGGDADTIAKVTAKGGTVAGQHRPIMLNECLHFLGIHPSADLNTQYLDSVKRPTEPILCVDCTLGYGGHSTAIMNIIAPTGGILHAIDQDGVELAKTEARLAPLASQLQQKHCLSRTVLYTKQENFGNLLDYTEETGITGAVSAILCDLGYSSMQIDDPQRGFSYKHDGPLDMRMKTEGLMEMKDVPNCMTAYEYLSQVKSVSALAAVLRENSDVDNAVAIALALLGKDDHSNGVPKTTLEFAARVRRALKAKSTAISSTKSNRKHRIVDTHKVLSAGKDSIKSTVEVDSIIAKCMQAIRIEVNAEFQMLERLLAQAPRVLAPKGRIVFLTFHSGEDRRVKKAFKQGVKDGVYSHWGREVVIASREEWYSNPRCKCAKLRWAVRA